MEKQYAVITGGNVIRFTDCLGFAWGHAEKISEERKRYVFVREYDAISKTYTTIYKFENGGIVE